MKRARLPQRLPLQIVRELCLCKLYLPIFCGAPYYICFRAIRVELFALRQEQRSPATIFAPLAKTVVTVQRDLAALKEDRVTVLTIAVDEHPPADSLNSVEQRPCVPKVSDGVLRPWPQAPPIEYFHKEIDASPKSAHAELGDHTMPTEGFKRLSRILPSGAKLRLVSSAAEIMQDRPSYDDKAFAPRILDSFVRYRVSRLRRLTRRHKYFKLEYIAMVGEKRYSVSTVY
jgi:hypothetical protein